MNTYQHRWLLAQALGTGVETAGGSSGSYGEPEASAVEGPTPSKSYNTAQIVSVSVITAIGGFLFGGIAALVWADADQKDQ